MLDIVHKYIEGMSSREKAYFKLFSSSLGRTEKNYFKLFDVLESMKDFDRLVVIEKLKHTPISRYISSESDKLFKQILKSQINYSFNKNSETKIQQTILSINILIEKGFKKYAIKILRKAKKDAYKNEYFTLILKLIEQEERLLFAQGILGFKAKLNSLETERRNVSSKISNLNLLRMRREEVKDEWFQHGFLSGSLMQVERLEKKYGPGMILPLSKKACAHYMYINAMMSFILERHKEAAVQFDAAIVLHVKHLNLFPTDDLLALFSNSLYNYALAKDPINFDRVTAEINSLVPELSIDKVYLDYILLVRSHELYYQILSIENILKTTKQSLHYLKINESTLPIVHANYICFTTTRALVTLGDFDGAIKILNKWSSLELIKYYIADYHILSLIIYLELDYLDLLRNKLPTYLVNIKKNRVYSVELKSIFQAFKKILKNPKDKISILLKLRKTLSDISEENKGIKTKYFSLESWLISKNKDLA